ncbi:hypothetical protein JOQ06_026191, partial [Pogonophryne albipinna]
MKFLERHRVLSGSSEVRDDKSKREILLLSFNQRRVPRVLQSRFSLPLALVCVPSSPAKTTKFKITVDTNQPPVDLSVLFPEFSTKSEDKEGNSLAFQFLAGAKVTVVASKTS